MILTKPSIIKTQRTIVIFIILGKVMFTTSLHGVQFSYM